MKNVSSRPMVTIDAKELSEVGYSGKDPVTIFEKLYLLTENDCNKAEWGIVHIDEFDKLCPFLFSRKGRLVFNSLYSSH